MDDDKEKEKEKSKRTDSPASKRKGDKDEDDKSKKKEPTSTASSGSTASISSTSAPASTPPAPSPEPDTPVDLSKAASDPRLIQIQKSQSQIHKCIGTNSLLDKVADWKLKRVTFDVNSAVRVSGPYSKQVAPSKFTHAYAQTISTYPHFTGKVSREGDPICDSYRVHVHKTASIFCVADGCGWGERPKKASNRAKDTFVQYFEQNVKALKSTKEIAEHLVNATAYANLSIYYDTNNPWMCGTTTCLGGLLVESSEIKENFKSCPWVFVGITVGDCKCFRYDINQRKCTDITAGNRMNIVDPRDPGGRLGAQLRNGDPDLRNLDFVFSPLAEGDILIVASDGVHDNLDPQVLGKSPREFGLDADNWDDVDVAQGTKIKTEYMNKVLTDLVNNDGLEITPAIITKKLIRHCRDTTSVSRQWMEQNPNKVLAVDYEKFPGKLDHATCLAIVVGPYDPSNEVEMQSRSLHKEVWPFS